jgi:hypothetical protein
MIFYKLTEGKIVLFLFAYKEKLMDILKAQLSIALGR